MSHAPYPWGLELVLDDKSLHRELFLRPDTRHGEPGAALRFTSATFDLANERKPRRQVRAWVTRYGMRVGEVSNKDMFDLVSGMFNIRGLPGTFTVDQPSLVVLSAEET